VTQKWIDEQDVRTSLSVLCLIGAYTANGDSRLAEKVPAN